MGLEVVIAVIAWSTAFVSGLIGLGGAVLLIPAYLYLLPFLGAGSLDMKTISGITSLQVLASSLFAAALHHRRGVVDRGLVLAMGIPIAATSFVGALLSSSFSSHALVILFSVMALAAAVLLLVRPESALAREGGAPYTLPGAAGTAAAIGLAGGMVGTPGAFLLSPLMMTLLRIPTRTTIGSTLGVVLFSAAATSAGKIIAGQVPAGLTAIAMAASLPGAYLGSLVSHVTSTNQLRLLLALLVGIVGLSMGIQALAAGT